MSSQQKIGVREVSNILCGAFSEQLKATCAKLGALQMHALPPWPRRPTQAAPGRVLLTVRQVRAGHGPRHGPVAVRVTLGGAQGQGLPGRSPMLCVLSPHLIAPLVQCQGRGGHIFLGGGHPPDGACRGRDGGRARRGAGVARDLPAATPPGAGPAALRVALEEGSGADPCFPRALSGRAGAEGPSFSNQWEVCIRSRGLHPRGLGHRPEGDPPLRPLLPGARRALHSRLPRGWHGRAAGGRDPAPLCSPGYAVRGKHGSWPPPIRE